MFLQSQHQITFKFELFNRPFTFNEISNDFILNNKVILSVIALNICIVLLYINAFNSYLTPQLCLFYLHR